MSHRWGEWESVWVLGSLSLRPLLAAVLGDACRATTERVRLEPLPNGNLFRRLWEERSRPQVGAVAVDHPWAAGLLSQLDLLDPFRPQRWPTNLPPSLPSRHADGRWHALAFAPFVLHGAGEQASFASLAALPRLAIPDPARSDAGLALLLATLDRARQAAGDVEAAWVWWQERRDKGLVLTDDPPAALTAIREGAASHALLPDSLPLRPPGGRPLRGLAPLPVPLAYSRGAVHPEDTTSLLNWTYGPDAAALVRGAGGLSPWHASDNGLAALADAAPPLDLAWTHGQYAVARDEWVRRGFSTAWQP